MIISIVNFTDSLNDEDVQQVIRAINRQIAQDFQPYWSMGATLRLEGHGDTEDRQSPAELRGDAIIYLWDKAADVPNAIGYHDRNNSGLPYGFVFTEIAKEVGEPWSVTLSHEALELIGDAEVNILAAGPNPNNPEQAVYFWYEMCDAVQAENYLIDGVAVSNFVLPLYFTVDSETGSRNDFLGRRHNDKLLSSFGINPGGYVGFFNPATGENETVTADALARKRLKIKEGLEDARARRATRYRDLNSAVVRKKEIAAA
jgi:hypothetical protein